ncbi:4'-phosphopantetheinyl transferase family protein [Lacrimispora saccharolytica]|uniref:4'-phosphopantetheinyl transferase n=1 Tax=Lacrimispora saccharolytica (strain ATCC 35040 / DSM 2544 / NRCC 2533 / WM1) TaxID=610130 RepID=D9R4E5_LACSW|nr:4'-phosphopantetheinyl transferase superfamily protein [Lacrimispora saccharolytica]ADL05015.1 4'-phosphopantetheinyl transferase [[Clostridium] saccharolyticum WM1]QRV20785.1 4'-phosphopantetheinyl transferase superfamily protein [Lacrimispora saccharolytica]
MIRIYLARYEADRGKKKRELEHELGNRLLYMGFKDLYGSVSGSQDQPVILRGEHGKPYLKDFPYIRYNISHTDGMVACGIGERELGIDLERIRPFRHNILRKVFSDAERRRMEDLPEGERSQYFFRIWTLKESYLKAVGCGITIPLTSISFEWKDKSLLSCSEPGVSFYQTLIDEEYVLSLCAMGDEEINFGQNLAFCTEGGSRGTEFCFQKP